ncbi:hypothetical protein GB883_04690 [Georgenia thermotolerans]|uniref:Mutator family transposase n=1 Tax=Georgenia thermotolerans TaxID=527326 RepID=A0A7J5US97_9MICO|nr:hypothetical protein GB883_04690 [Georgenia thermotolerans]
MPELIRSVLERGLAAELSDHLGYERGDPAGRGSPNSRNGSTDKTPQSEVGQVPLSTPRERAGTFEPRLAPKGTRRLTGLDEMIVSLYAGGMTVQESRPTWPARCAPSCPMRRSRTTPTRSWRRSRPGSPAAGPGLAGDLSRRARGQGQRRRPRR